MTVYYAHCVGIYDTPQEQRDVELLTRLGFVVVNPNTPQINAWCTIIKNAWRPDGDHGRRGAGFRDAGDQIMHEIFMPLVLESKALAFRALPDGRIPAGVAKEIEWAKSKGLPVFELPTFAYDRIMSVELTRTYLREMGER